MKARIFLLFLLCISQVFLYAQTTYYSNSTTTNFNTLSGWSLNTNGTGANPAALNNSVRLVVQNSHSKTTSAAATVNRLTIRSGASVTANHAITISGSNDRFEIENGGFYTHNNTGNVANTIFNGEEVFGATSTFQINNWQSSGTSVTPSGLDQSAYSAVDENDYYYGNLIVNWPGSGNWNQNWPSYPTATRLAAGNFTILSVGDFRFSQANNRLPDVYVIGNFTMSSTGAGTNTLNFSSGNNSIGYLNVNGNVTHSNGTITASSNSSEGQIWTYGTQAGTWNFTVNNRSKLRYVVVGAKQVTLQTDFDLGTNLTGEKLYIDPAANFDAQQFVISNGSSNSYISNYGIFRTAHAGGLWTNGQSSRSVSNANDFYMRLLSGSTVQYYGAAGQVVSSLNGLSSSYDQYENVTLQSGNSKQLEADIIVNGVFNFTAGGNYLNAGAFNVTIDTDGSISNAGNTAYFILQPTTNNNGRLRQNDLLITPRLFPVGSATNYLPATITPVSAGTDFSVSVFRGTTTNGSPSGAAFGSRSFQVDAVWRVDRSAGSSDAVVRFDWLTGSIEGTGFSASANNQIGIWRYEAGNWILTPNSPGPNFLANNSSNHALTGGSVTSFGSAGTGFAYIVANIDVLPGKLLSFTANAKEQENLLKWTVADPAQFSRYDLEVSKDGIAFTHLASAIAGQKSEYVQNDRVNTQQTVYYRLKMWDLFNQAYYSQVIVVKRIVTQELLLLQNPVKDQLVFRHPVATKASFVVLDLSGRLFLKGMIPAGNLQTSVSAALLPPGSYLLHYTDGSKQFAQKFIK